MTTADGLSQKWANFGWAAAIAAARNGHWMVSHPDELVATFFIPLPDPIRLPHGTTFPTFTKPGAVEVDLLEAAPLPLVLIPIDKPATQISALPDDSDANENGEDGASQRNWTNKYVLSSSILFHQLSSDPFARSGLDATLAVMKAASGRRMSPDELANEVRTVQQSAQGLSPELRELGLGPMTVAECAVGIRLVGAIPEFSEPLVRPDPDRRFIGPVEAEDVFNDYIPMWPWRTAARDSALDVRLLARRLHNALDVAISDLRSIQRACHAIGRDPITLVTRQRLPFLVPVTLRAYSTIGQHTAEAKHALLAANANLSNVLPTAEFGHAEIAAVHSMRSRLEDHPFTTHLDLHREATRALHRYGDTRGTAIFAGVSAESALDELLLHLMWEERQTPEKAAGDWKDGLATRVKTEYSRRLRGGSWDSSGSASIGKWSRDVADLRHRVVHGAYEPTISEARTSINAVDELVSYLCDRLADAANLSRYPRSALALAGERGLARRKSYTRRVRRLQEDPSEPPWSATYTRWREAWRRLRRDKTTSPRIPNEANAYLLAIISPHDTSLRWCLHDRLQHLALEVSVDPVDVPEHFANQCRVIREQFVKESDIDPLSVAYQGRLPWSMLGGAWREEYHLVPMTQVMVDRSDFTIP